MGFEAVARGRKVSAVEAGPVEGTWDLPEGWRWERLGNCGNWSSGGTPSAKDARYYGGTIPWLTSGELNDAVVSRSEKMITEEGYANSSVKWLPSDTLLVAMYGATIGKAAVTGFRCTTNQAVAACQPHPGYNVRYLLYYVLSQRDNLRNLGQGGAQPNISQALLKDYPCPVAPAVDQQKIVARIDALFSEIDEGVAALAEARAGVEVYRKALLKAAVTGELTADWRAANPPEETGEQLLGCILADRRARWHADPKNARKRYTEPAGPDTEGLPELPEGWTWASIQQLCDPNRAVAYGVLQPGPHQPDGVPLVRVTDVVDGRVIQADLKRVAASVAAKFPRTVLRGGEVLLTVVGTIGRTAMVPAELAGANVARAVAVLPTVGCDPRWIELVLRYEPNRLALEGVSHEVARKTLNLEDVRPFAIPVPPTNETAVLVERLSDLLDDARQQATAVEAQRLGASTLRQSILAAAFRGELLV